MNKALTKADIVEAVYNDKNLGRNRAEVKNVVEDLLALMKQVGVFQLVPVGEIAPGVVLTQFCYRGRSYHIIAKSGGFGAPDLFIKIADGQY